uniref:ElyC/SanA/YdcF family protein n=1 Tax=Staphylococcus hominis TaxID=1290 RepID=UPI003709654C
MYKLHSHNSNIFLTPPQPPHQPISHPLAINNYLIKSAVSSSSIFIQSQSTTTYQNFLYSKSFINTS